MIPSDPTQSMPALLQTIMALSGEQQQNAATTATPPPTPVAPSPAQADLGPVSDESKADFFKKNKDIASDRDRWQKIADSLGTLSPAQDAVDAQTKQLHDLLDPNSDYNAQFKQQIDQLNKVANTPVSIPQQLQDKADWINRRQQAAYSGQGKLGMAAQFLQDMLRRPGTPSGRQAVYEMANKEYDQAVKDAQEQATAQKQQAASQAQSLSQQRLNHGQELTNNLALAKFEELKRKDNIDALTKGLNAALTGQKLDTALRSQDVQNAVQVFDREWGKLPAQQQVQNLIQDLMKTQNLSQAQASVKASEIMALIEASKRAIGSSTSTTTQPAHLDANGNMVPEVQSKATTPNIASPNILNRIQDLMGLPKNIATPPFVPGQIPGVQSPGAQGAAKPQMSPKSGPMSSTAPTPTTGSPLDTAVLPDGTRINPLAKQLGSLSVDPSTILSRRKGNEIYNQQILDQAQKYWQSLPWDEKEMGGPKPEWTDKLAKQKAAAEQAYSSSGKSGQKVMALNTALRHVDLLDQAIGTLQNNPNQFVNFVANNWRKYGGDQDVTNFQSIADRLGKEIASAYVAGGGGEREREAIEQEFSSSQSPQQLMGRVVTNLNLLTGAAQTMANQYKRDTFGQGTRSIIQPDNIKTLQRLQSLAQNKVQSSDATQKEVDDFYKKHNLKKPQ